MKSWDLSSKGNEAKLPQIEQRLPKHSRSQLYHLYRDLSARVHPTILGEMLAIDLDVDEDWVLVDHPREWDVPSGDYLLLGCFLVWSLAQTIENSVRAEDRRPGVAATLRSRRDRRADSRTPYALSSERPCGLEGAENA